MHVVFVCTGNICRSPMAEVITRRALADAGLDDRVTVSSAATTNWHVGRGMDPRAGAELRAQALPDVHTVTQVDDEDLGADLVVAMDRGHRSHLLDAGADPSKVVLMRSFDPDAESEDVADPYYGDDAGFGTTRQDIDFALPGLLDEIRRRLA